MPIMVKRFTKGQKDAFFDFFDNRAFTDGSPYYPCYCDAYYLTPEEVINVTDARAKELGGTIDALRQSLRESAERLIDRGTMQGYLAYDDRVPVGWCNAGDRSKYTRVGDLNPALRREGDIYFTKDVPGKVFAVICFEVAPSHRGRGIAKEMLLKAIEDAASENYEYIEAYPKVSSKERFDVLDFTGPIALYLSEGFYETHISGGTAVMRKDLR